MCMGHNKKWWEEMYIVMYSVVFSLRASSAVESAARARVSCEDL